MPDKPEMLSTPSPGGIHRPGTRRWGSTTSATEQMGAGEVRPSGPPPDVVLILRRDGSITFASGALAAVPKADVTGTSIYQYVLEGQHDAVRSCLESIFAGAATAECELKGLRPNAPNAWFECRFSASRSGGTPPSANVVIRDITVRRQREERLREQLEALRARSAPVGAAAPVAPAGLDESAADPLARFLSAVQESGEAMFVTDEATGRIVDANTTACRWLRMRRGELLGTAANGLHIEFPLLFPPASDTTLTDTRGAQRPLILNHAQHRRRDRSTFPVEVSLTRHQIEGRMYVLAVVREVKGREDAQQRVTDLERIYESLFHRTRDAVLRTARDGRIEALNAAAVALLASERENLLGRQLQQLYLEPHDVQRFREAVRQYGEVRDLRVALRRGDGSRVSVRLWAVPHRGSDGGIRGYECLLQEAAADPRRARRVSSPTHMVMRPTSPPSARTETRDGSGDSPTAPHGGAVLLLDADHQLRDESRVALETAGMQVIEAVGVGQALRAVRDPALQLDLALLDSEQAAVDEYAVLEAAQRYRPGMPVLLLGGEGGSAEEAAGQEVVRGWVRKPAHPLALLQCVREVLGAQ